MDIKPILKQFDLKPKEIDVYLACLELGSSNAIAIAKKAAVIRTTVYDILVSLINKGLIVQSQKGKKRLFYAEEPEKLNNLLEDKRKKLGEIMPLLKSIYNTAGTKPKIRYYEGKDGLKEVYRDTYRFGFKGDLVAFVTEDIISRLGLDFANEYIQARSKHKIFARVIGPDTEAIKNYKKDDKKFFKETRLVDHKKFPFSIEMNIYGQKISFLSFKEEMGIIIESTEIAKNMKLLFELAWQGAK
jgi:HTH-type transcriptional regulator, sugar sensing transcriptional regulator